MKKKTILRAWYLACRELHIPVDPHVAWVAIRSVGNYESIRNQYNDHVVDAIDNYMNGVTGMAVGKGVFKRAMATAFTDAFETGYADGSGTHAYDPESDDTDWIAQKIETELGYIDGLFQSLKEIIKDDQPPTSTEIRTIAVERAAGYVRTLDGVYAQGKLRGKRNIMLTFDGPDGNESCNTCKSLKGQRHRAKWWVAHDYVPTPGNEVFECGCYRCEHQLKDDNGNVWAGSLE